MTLTRNPLFWAGLALLVALLVSLSVFEVPETEIDWVRSEVPRIMAEVAQLRVPLLAEIGFGPNWEQAH